MDIILASIALWVFFIVAATLKEKILDKERHPILEAIALFVGFWFVVVDVIYNYTYGALLFMEMASGRRKTLTARLKHILHSGEYQSDSWRYRLAVFMCKYMIEPWDFGHCALDNL